jgi:hypothetical protein
MKPTIIGNATAKWVAIYEFCEWPSLEPRYVGKTTQYMIDRRKAHLRTAKRGDQKPLYRWLRKRLDGRGFATRLIEHVPPSVDWQERERYWIRTYREAGHHLLNLTDGGEGLHGHRFSEEHRDRIATALRRGKTYRCTNCATEFYRKPNAAKARNLFCSRVCANAFNKGGHRNA